MLALLLPISSTRVPLTSACVRENSVSAHVTGARRELLGHCFHLVTCDDEGRVCGSGVFQREAYETKYWP